MSYFSGQGRVFIGALGQMLGEEKVNIATFHLGRTAAG